MRFLMIAAAFTGAALPNLAAAQTAKNSPDSIVCAMTGSCDAPAPNDGRVAVGDEKAFSLSRVPAGQPSATAKSSTAAPASRTRAVPTRAARRVVPAKVSPGGGVDMLVTFRLGSAEMTPQAQAEARAFAQAMAAPAMSGMRFAIEGHTDSTGAHDRNMALSQARAQSVMDYLVTQGVDASRLTAKGFGPDKPLQGTRASSPANRRVEFVKQA